jgi:hypothetical protein
VGFTYAKIILALTMYTQWVDYVKTPKEGFGIELDGHKVIVVNLRTPSKIKFILAAYVKQ